MRQLPLPAGLVSDAHRRLLQVFIHGICLCLLVRIYWLGYQDQLGGDPVERIIHYTGIGALNLLLLTLLVSPLQFMTRQSLLVRLRRPLGLWCFAWATAHIANYLVYDLQLQWALVTEELTQRPYIIVGLCSWLILLVLAVTSLPALMRLIRRHWKKIHRLIYPLALLICVHFWWSVKADITEPLIYVVLSLSLLWMRPLLRIRPTRQPSK